MPRDDVELEPEPGHEPPAVDRSWELRLREALLDAARRQQAGRRCRR